jgi:predicted PurR-regulated permease PerM
MPIRTNEQKNVWKATIIIALIVALLFLLPQLSVLILACLMAFVFHPLYRKLKRKNGWLAACATLAISLLVVIIPIVVVLMLTAAQLFQLAETLNTPETTRTISVFLNDTNTFFRTTIQPITGIHVDLSADGIGSFLRTSLPEIIRATSAFMLGTVSNIPQLVVAAIG